MKGQRIPKPERRQEFVPAMQDSELSMLLTELAPAERRALAEICEEGDVFVIDGQAYLQAPLSEASLEALAAFGSEGEDLEDANEDYSPADGEASLGGHHASTWEVDLEEDLSDEEPSLAGVNNHGAGFSTYSDAERRGEVDLEVEYT